MVFEHLRNGQHLYTGRSRIGKLLGFFHFHCLCTFEKIVMWMVPNAQRGKLIAKTHRRLSSLRLRTDEMQSKTMSGKKVGSSENSSGHKKTQQKRNHKEFIAGLCWSWWQIGWALDDHSLSNGRATRWGLISNQISICWIRFEQIWIGWLWWMPTLGLYIALKMLILQVFHDQLPLLLMEPWYNMKHSCEVSTLSCSATLHMITSTLHMITLMHHDVQEMLHPSISCSFMTGCEPTKNTLRVGT